MTIDEMIALLNQDLKREYSHWHFYMQAAALVTGLHREEYSEFFMEEAKGEMEHVLEFSKLIIGLGGIPVPGYINYFEDVDTQYPGIKSLLEIALDIEQEVVANYVERMDQAEELEKDSDPTVKVDGRYIHIFLEDQILDSRSAVDNIRQIMRGI